jgi:hypothetical protein
MSPQGFSSAPASSHLWGSAGCLDRNRSDRNACISHNAIATWPGRSGGRRCGEPGGTPQWRRRAAIRQSRALPPGPGGTRLRGRVSGWAAGPGAIAPRRGPHGCERVVSHEGAVTRPVGGASANPKGLREEGEAACATRNSRSSRARSVGLQTSPQLSGPPTPGEAACLRPGRPERASQLGARGECATAHTSPGRCAAPAVGRRLPPC